jgi:hypothetical protein
VRPLSAISFRLLLGKAGTLTHGIAAYKAAIF